MESRRRLLVALWVTVAALTPSACGDEGDAPDGSGGEIGAETISEDTGAPTDSSKRTTGTRPSAPAAEAAEEKADARETVTRVYGALAAGEQLDTDGLCELMTAKAQRETARYARIASDRPYEKWDCEKGVDFLAERSQRLGKLDRALKADVLGVNVRGGRATATIQLGNGDTATLPLLKRGGEWKLDSTRP